jgi:hypothetical protein
MDGLGGGGRQHVKDGDSGQKGDTVKPWYQKWEHWQIIYALNRKVDRYIWDDDEEGVDDRDPIQRLNYLGEEGWELAAMYFDDPDLIYILKRPLA